MVPGYAGAMRVRRYHGLGNDYLVLETAEVLDAPLVRALCDRHRGVGADGVLQPLPSRLDAQTGLPVTPFAVRIWNPDGSRAEKSGNGLRILARWLRDHRAAPAAFGVEVRLDDEPGEVVRCAVAGPGGSGTVTVSMGPARFAPEQVPVTRALQGSLVQVAGETLELTAVGLGNPHCVCFLADLSTLEAAPWRTWGAALEVHPLFPRRTNVQFAAVLPRQPEDPPDLARFAVRIWERGAGETQASGSSACAVAAAAVALGRAEHEVWVHMPGGVLAVHVGADDLVLVGPVEEVGHIELAASWLAARRPEAG